MGIETPPMEEVHDEGREEALQREQERFELEHTAGAHADFGPPTPDERRRFEAAMTTEAEREAARLREFVIHRDPSDEVGVTEDRAQVRTRLDALAELKKEHEHKAKNGDAASALEVKVITKAEEHLKEELSHIDRAGEYNVALDAFSEMKKTDAANLDAISKTGKDKHGNKVELHDGQKNPLKLSGREMRRLAQFAKSGVHHVTWDQLSELYEVADTIIHEVFVSTAKRMLGWKN